MAPQIEAAVARRDFRNQTGGTTVMTTTVDVIVLGTGSAAQSVAYPCREAGWSVAIVDYHPFGGTCQLRGCDPKKVLVGVSDLVDWRLRAGPVPQLAGPDPLQAHIHRPGARAKRTEPC